MMRVEVIVFFCLLCSVLPQCLPNYQYTDPNTGLCAACLPNCLSCLDGTTCYQCMPQYYLNGDTCSRCSFGCAVCSNSSLCSTCNSGLYLTSLGSCSACSTGVATCTIAAIQSCSDNYFLLSSICAGCLANCLTCNDFVSCSNCDPSYYLAPNASACLPCPTNCLICTSATTCSYCAEGYTQNSNGCTPYNCTSIDPFCLSCTASTCLSCRAGKYLLNGGCLQGASVLCLQATGSDYTYCDTSNYGCQSYAQVQNDSSGNQMPVCLPLSATKTEQYIYTSGSAPICSGSCSAPNTLDLTYATTQAYYTLRFYLNLRFYANVPARSLTLALTNATGGYLANQTINVDVSAELNTFAATDPACLNCPFAQTLVTGSFAIAGGQYPTNFSLRDSAGRIAVVEWMLEHLICQVSQCSNCSSAVDCYGCFPPYLLQLSACVNNCDPGFYLYGSTCYLACPATTYTLSSAYTCLPCLSPCATCADSTACLSCVPLYFLEGSTCGLNCSSSALFPNATTNLCQPCPNPCVTCSAINSTAVSCLSCASGYLMQGGSCVFACPWGQYGNYVNNTSQCLPCTNACSSCYIDEHTCHSCTNGYLLLQTTCASLTVCPDGYYVDSVFNRCLQCHYPCKTCTTNAANCASCQKGVLLNGVCLDACPATFYANYTNSENPLCSACLLPCINCQGPTSCLSCAGTNFLYQDGCVTNCPSSFYANSNNNTCTPCLPPCSTCSSATACLSCATGYLDGSSCTLQCNSSSYISSSFACTQCLAPCLSCYSSSLCLQCALPSVLFSSSCISQSQCLSQTGYYPSLTNTSGECASCAFPCLACANNSVTCTSCQPNYLYLSNTLKCVSQCPSSYYQNGTNCSLCSSNCYHCDLAPDNCTLCASGRYLDSASRTCLASCPNGYYGDDQTQSCLPCVLPCANCYNAYLCSACTSGILYNKQCVSTCPLGSVLNASANTCAPCTDNCLTCSNTTSHCLSCSTGNYLTSASCTTTCPATYYGNDYTNACDPCIAPCNNCSSDTNCLSCLTNYYFFNNQCVSNCPDSYFADNATAQCLTCNLTICLTCSTSANHCLTCAVGYYLYQLSCTLTCPAPTYPNSILGTCDTCPFPCDGCNNYTYCTSCATSYYLFGNRCFSHCPIGYYPDNTSACLPCATHCMYCNSLAVCIECAGNYSLLNSSCTLTCPSAYYLGAAPITNYNACLQCQSDCLNCSALDYCLTCISGLIQFNGMCLSSCPVFYFPTNASECAQCSTNCASCTNASVCLSCIATYLYNNLCVVDCPAQTYPYQGESCKQCTHPCFNCSGDYTCLTCITGYIYFHEYCVSACPSDVWYYPSNNSCNSDCPSPYNRLTSNMTCFTGNCGPLLVTLNGYCIATCGNGYYTSPDQQCLLCSTNPSLCNNLFTADLEILYVEALTLNLYFSQQAQIANFADISVQFVDIEGNPVPQTLTDYTIDAYYIQLRYTHQAVSLVNVTLTIPYVASLDSSQSISTNFYKQELPSYSDYSPYPSSPIITYLPLIFIVLLAVLVVINMCNQASRFVQVLDYMQLVAVTLFLNIQYPPVLESFLSACRPVLFLFSKNMLPLTPYLFSPPKFIYYHADTLLFRNQLLLLAIFLVALIAFLIVIAINTYNRNNCATLVRLVRYRLLNDLFSICLTPLFLFACQVANVHGTSLAVTVFIILIGIGYVVWISYKIIQLKRLTEMEGLLGDFERTSSKVGLMYTPFGYLRRIVVTFGLGIAPYQPIATITLLLVLTFLTMICVYFYQPFDNQYTDYVTIFMESSLTLYVVCLTILGLNVLQPANSHNMGLFVVSLVTVTMAVCVGWLIYLTVNDIRTKGCFPKMKELEDNPDAKDDYSEKKYDQDQAQIRKMQGLSKLEKPKEPAKKQESKIGHQNQIYNQNQNLPEVVYDDSASGFLNRFRGESEDLISKKDNNDEFKHWNQQNSDSNEGSGEGVHLPQMLIKIQRNEGSS